MLRHGTVRGYIYGKDNNLGINCQARRASLTREVEDRSHYTLAPQHVNDEHIMSSNIMFN